jgi:KDO2-lipid IV(A) lauroyltransferase
MSTDKIALYHFWQPRYWPVWIGVGLLKLVFWLPQPARMAIGRWLGLVLMRVAGSRRRIAERNIAICFPELTPGDQALLTRRHFESLGMSFIELGIAWWSSDDYMNRVVELSGIGHLHTALEQGKGVLMLGGHFAALEMSGRPLKALMPPMAAMYRPSNNPLIDQLMRRCRGRSTADLITKHGIRQLLKVLKENRPVWYAADQAYSRRGSVLAPFFGEPAATNTAVSQIARLSGAPVVPFFQARVDNGSGYRLEVLPALENFPSGDDAADAARLNEVLEVLIRKVPEQYYWVHRRFKGRPDGYPDPYK